MHHSVAKNAGVRLRHTLHTRTSHTHINRIWFIGTIFPAFVCLLFGFFLYLFILICGYGDKFGFLEHICTERWIGQLQYIVGSYQMKTWLIFVHRVQNGLQEENNRWINDFSSFYRNIFSWWVIEFRFFSNLNLVFSSVYNNKIIYLHRQTIMNNSMYEQLFLGGRRDEVFANLMTVQKSI